MEIFGILSKQQEMQEQVKKSRKKGFSKSFKKIVDKGYKLEKHFTCNICKETFVTKDSVIDHIRFHEIQVNLFKLYIYQTGAENN